MTHYETLEPEQRLQELTQTIQSMWYWVKKTVHAEQGYITQNGLEKYAEKFNELGVKVDA